MDPSSFEFFVPTNENKKENDNPPKKTVKNELPSQSFFVPGGNNPGYIEDKKPENDSEYSFFQPPDTMSNTKPNQDPGNRSFNFINYNEKQQDNKTLSNGVNLSLSNNIGIPNPEVVFEKGRSKHSCGLMKPANFSTYWIKKEYNENVQCSPENISMTFSSFPANEQLSYNIGVPLMCNFSPFRNIKDIKKADFGEEIPRCKSCKTYVNPMFQFLDGGWKFKCNVCNKINDTPKDYFCELDENGIRKDISSRDELLYGSIDMAAPEDYTTRTPQPACYFFLIDVSQNSIKSGACKVFCETVRSQLKKLKGDKRKRVGIITFDSRVHFFNLDEKLKRPSLMIIPELKDTQALIPYHGSIFVNLEDSFNNVDKALEVIPKMFENTTDTESCLGTALNAAGSILGRVGGMLMVLMCKTPLLGAHDLSEKSFGFKMNRFNKKEKKKFQERLSDHSQLFVPFFKNYEKLGEMFSVDHISCFIFGLKPQNEEGVGIKEIYRLCANSGGGIKYYNDFVKNKSLLKNDIKKTLVEICGLEAVSRVRCGPAVKTDKYTGFNQVRKRSLLVHNLVEENLNFGADFSPILSTGFPPNEVVSIQSATLYTTPHGDRRIIVHNLYLPVGKSFEEIRNTINPITSSLLFCKYFSNVLIYGDKYKNMFKKNNCLHKSIIKIYENEKQGGGVLFDYEYFFYILFGFVNRAGGNYLKNLDSYVAYALKLFQSPLLEMIDIVKVNPRCSKCISYLWK